MGKFKQSYGILLYRFNPEKNGRLEVFLGHQNAPKFWSRSAKKASVWGIPKGRRDHKGEDPLSVALREFKEEIGVEAPYIPYEKLFKYTTPHKKVRKRIVVFIGDATGLDIQFGVSQHHTIEFPPKSGRFVEYFEMDDARWFSEKKAYKNVLWGQKGALKIFFAQHRI